MGKIYAITLRRSGWKALALIGLIVTGTGHLADYLLSDRERGWFREALAGNV